MSRRNRKKKFIEDEFDLDEFIQKTELSTFQKLYKKNQRYINAISVVIMILAFIIAYLAYSIISYYIDLWQNKRIAQIAQDINESANVPVAVETPVVLPTQAAPSAAPGTAQPSEKPLTIRQEFIDMMDTFGNGDIVGYLIIDDTKINYPVVKGTDNDFYLNHDLNKKPNVAGSVFMDFENRVDELGYNTVIYGHNMKNESMFHNLRYYVDKAFFENHRFITLKTLYDDTKWEVFAFYETDTQFDYIKTHFSGKDDFYELASAMKEKSLYDTGVEISRDDKILTLSTCTNLSDDSRYTLNAKLIKE